MIKAISFFDVLSAYWICWIDSYYSVSLQSILNVSNCLMDSMHD
jgi:hypothetical protein